MRPVIRERWLEFTEKLEGGVPYLYADVRGLITIAFGNLADPLSEALKLPLVTEDGKLATGGDITAAWLRLKGDPNAARLGHTYARNKSTLRLTRPGMNGLALRKLDANHAELLKQLPELDDYPACATFALHSLAWACGPHAHFPKLFSAVTARDWEAAAIHIMMDEWTTSPTGQRILNAGLVPRNVANKILMRNAARVDAYHLDPDLLDWVHVLGVADAETLPELPSVNTPLPLVNTPIMERDTSASSPTIHADPTTYLRPDPDDDAA